MRDEMFGVIEGIGGLDAEKGLLGIISSDKDEIVRYRAFESILAARKADGIQPGLEAFPASAAYKKVDVDDLLVKLIEKQGAGGPAGAGQDAGVARAAGAHDRGDGAGADRARARRRRRWRSWRATRRPSKGSRPARPWANRRRARPRPRRRDPDMALFGRKSLRQFACNDALWATFERMAGDQEKNVDELVNDALEAYAQLAGYQTGIERRFRDHGPRG